MYRLLTKNLDVLIPPRNEGYFERLGKQTVEMLRDIQDFITFIGHLFSYVLYLFKVQKIYVLKRSSIIYTSQVLMHCSSLD